MSESKFLLAVPTIALVVLAAVFVVIPIFTGIFANMAEGAPAEGLAEMSKTIKDCCGVGLGIGVLIMLFGLAWWFSKGFSGTTTYDSPLPPIIKTPILIPKKQCPYCRRDYTEVDREKGYCGGCGAPVRMKEGRR